MPVSESLSERGRGGREREGERGEGVGGERGGRGGGGETASILDPSVPGPLSSSDTLVNSASTTVIMNDCHPPKHDSLKLANSSLDPGETLFPVGGSVAAASALE